MKCFDDRCHIIGWSIDKEIVGDTVDRMSDTNLKSLVVALDHDEVHNV